MWLWDKQNKIREGVKKQEKNLPKCEMLIELSFILYFCLKNLIVWLL